MGLYKSEEMVGQIHDLLLHQLNRDRAYITHTQPYECYDSSNNKSNGSVRTQNRKRSEDEDNDIVDEGRSPLLKKLSTQLSVDGLKQKEVAEMWGVSDAAIFKRMKKIRTSLKKVLPEWLKTSYGI